MYLEFNVVDEKLRVLKIESHPRFRLDEFVVVECI
jgi:hypothetical protein